MVSASYRSLISKSLVIALLLSILLPARSFAEAQPFNDTDNSYARAEIEALSEAGILSGVADGYFEPARPITRAELAKIIVLSAGLEENPDGASAFRDVGTDSWYRGYVGALLAAGITKGTSADTFSPDAPVTREELVVLIIRALGLDETAIRLAAELNTADSAEVSDWAKAQVALAYRIGLVKGTDNNGGLSRFEPKKLAERQAVARLAYEFRTHRDSYISAAQTLLSSGESTGTGTTDGSKETAPAVTGVIVINSSTVEVTLSSAPKSVSKEQFSFSNGLTVTAASIKSGSPNVVVLTTSGMTAGTPYTLSYEGEPTELSIIGVAASTPGAPAGSGGSDDTDGSDDSSGSDDSDGPDDSDDSDNALTKEQINQLLSSGTPQGTITITESGTYGAASGPATTVEHLILDPGPEGVVTLQNIHPTELEVRSGAPDSIHLVNTIIKELRVSPVNNRSTNIRIEVRNGVETETTVVESQAVLESSSVTGKLGTIRLTPSAAGKTLTLRGNIDSDVKVEAPGSSIHLQPPSSGNPLSTSVRSLIVSASALVKTESGSTLQSVSLTGNHPSLEIDGTGTVEEVKVDESASGATLSLQAGANIKTLTANSPLTLKGDANVLAKVKNLGSAPIQMDDDLRNNVKSIAIANAEAAIDDLGDFTTYSEEFQSKLDKANEAYFIATETYGASDADIANKGKLDSINRAVEQLMADVKNDFNNLAIGFQGGDSADFVRHDLILDSTGDAGSSIVWSSDRTDVITNQGIVIRPAVGQPDAAVTLTAVISKNGYTYPAPKSFTVKVKAQESAAIIQLNRTGSETVQVLFDKPPGSVAASDFTFDNGLDILSATLDPAGLIVNLQTGPQVPGTTYTLSYKGESTGLSFTAGLEAPEILYVQTGIRQVTLSWSSVADAARYSVYMKEAGDSSFTFAGEAPDPLTFYVVTGLEEGKEYLFYVTASNDRSTSLPSNVVSGGRIPVGGYVYKVQVLHSSASVTDVTYDSSTGYYHVPADITFGDKLMVTFSDGPGTETLSESISLPASGKILINNNTITPATIEEGRKITFVSDRLFFLSSGQTYTMEVTELTYGAENMPFYFKLLFYKP